MISTFAERSRAGVTRGKRLRRDAATVDSGRRVTKRVYVDLGSMAAMIIQLQNVPGRMNHALGKQRTRG